MYREMRVELASQRSGHSWIFFEYNDALHPTYPDLPSSTADVLQLRGGWKPQLHRQQIVLRSRCRLPAHWCFFGQRLEWFGLEFPILFQQNVYFSFRLFQFFAASGGKLHPLLEERERLL